MIKKLIPYPVKVQINLWKNKITDVLNGHSSQYAKTTNPTIKYNGNIEITQDVKQTATTAAKFQNFEIAINRIQQYQINPNQIFSFWKAVGRPSKKNGFAESRSIVNGKIIPTYGGGLCQLSGLIYYACLMADLDILERYNHSADIYTEETRFTPLGSDATVVYGFKDLKIRNNLEQPIQFAFSIKPTKLTIRIHCSDIIKIQTVEFIQSKPNEIHTFVNGQFKTKSKYLSN